MSALHGSPEGLRYGCYGSPKGLRYGYGCTAALKGCATAET